MLIKVEQIGSYSSKIIKKIIDTNFEEIIEYSYYDSSTTEKLIDVYLSRNLDAADAYLKWVKQLTSHYNLSISYYIQRHRKMAPIAMKRIESQLEKYLVLI